LGENLNELICNAVFLEVML